MKMPKLNLMDMNGLLNVKPEFSLPARINEIILI
jgi:hypothetical protein